MRRIPLDASQFVRGTTLAALSLIPGLAAELIHSPKSSSSLTFPGTALLTAPCYSLWVQKICLGISDA